MGGYGPEGTEGLPPYPTGHKSETLLELNALYRTMDCDQSGTIDREDIDGCSVDGKSAYIHE